MLFKKDQVVDPAPNPEGSIFENGLPYGESILGTYSCFYRFTSGEQPTDDYHSRVFGEIPNRRRRCNFAFSLKNHSLTEGDYIHIRTEKTIEKSLNKFSYMFTFLIELDPL